MASGFVVSCFIVKLNYRLSPQNALVVKVKLCNETFTSPDAISNDNIAADRHSGGLCILLVCISSLGAGWERILGGGRCVVLYCVPVSRHEKAQARISGNWCFDVLHFVRWQGS